MSKKLIDHDTRICKVEGCNQLGQLLGGTRRDGCRKRRSRCPVHWELKLAEGGYKTHRLHRKKYCENIDGRLGFICTTTIVNTMTNPEIFNDDSNPYWDAMLEVDHIDGNPKHDHEDNHQTLCRCCHAVKSAMFRDDQSPGQKLGKKTYRTKKTLAILAERKQIFAHNSKKFNVPER